MRDDNFEWDDAKAAVNRARHGVPFAVARHVFDDLHAIERIENSMDYGEERLLTLGQVGDRLIAVVWTQRGERIRIISARPATPQERRTYHG